MFIYIDHSSDIFKKNMNQQAEELRREFEKPHLQVQTELAYIMKHLKGLFSFIHCRSVKGN